MQVEPLRRSTSGLVAALVVAAAMLVGTVAPAGAGTVQLHGAWTPTGAAEPMPDTTGPAALGAPEAWGQGVTGAGIGIAVVDTGVEEVPALSGRVVTGVDLSGVHRRDRHRDAFGHGTPVAGLAAGADGVGVAPGAHVVPVRIADGEGRTDAARLLVALDWVHANADRLGIRVVNLSLGADGPVDLVRAAVERLWDAGLVVVVAAGNNGAGSLGAPADAPLVLTVGATDGAATSDPTDDVPATWSATGVDLDGRAKPDLSAPGMSLVAPGAPDSWAWTNHPEGHVGDGMQRVTGTSFSAGLVSGAAALVLEAHPTWSPDQVLGALDATATQVAGARLPWVPAAIGLETSEPANGDAVPVDHEPLIELGPPSNRLLVELAGDASQFTPLGSKGGGQPAPDGEVSDEGSSWYGSSWYGSSWYGSSWYGSSWYGSSWYGSSWYGSSWYGSSWYGSSWYAGGWS